MEYLLHLLALWGIFSLLAVSLDLVLGHGGLLSLAHAAFFGVGAYTYAILSVRYGVGFPVAAGAAGATAALASVALSLPTQHLRRDYLAIATFAFQVISSDIFINWDQVTRGPMGIPDIPVPVVFGRDISSPLSMTAFVLLLSSAGIGLLWQVTRGPFGKILHVIREDQSFAQALGSDVSAVKAKALALSACLAGFAGSLYASYAAFIDPSSFDPMDAILIVAMVIVGGSGRLAGPVVGAALMIGLPESLRFLGLGTATAANMRQILFGSLLVCAVLWRPQGLLGRKGDQL